MHVVIGQVCLTVAMGTLGIDAVQAVVGQHVQLAIPKPREDILLTGVVDVVDDEYVLLVEAAPSPRYEQVVLQPRYGDGVLHAYWGTPDGPLVGRVAEIRNVDE